MRAILLGGTCALASLAAGTARADELADARLRIATPTEAAGK